MNEKTSLFDVNLVKKKLISTTLKEVYDALVKITGKSDSEYFPQYRG